jgi:hypothetical protein
VGNVSWREQFMDGHAALRGGCVVEGLSTLAKGQR